MASSLILPWMMKRVLIDITILLRIPSWDVRESGFSSRQLKKLSANIQLRITHFMRVVQYTQKFYRKSIDEQNYRNLSWQILSVYSIFFIFFENYMKSGRQAYLTLTDRKYWMLKSMNLLYSSDYLSIDQYLDQKESTIPLYYSEKNILAF